LSAVYRDDREARTIRLDALQDDLARWRDRAEDAEHQREDLLQEVGYLRGVARVCDPRGTPRLRLALAGVVGLVTVAAAAVELLR